jgi:long-chain acyl-CoA synthetase
MAQLSFWTSARMSPDAVAVVGPDGIAVTKGELLDACDRLAHALREAGLGIGDVVATLLPNSVDALTTYLAGSQVGLWTVPINSHLAAPEVAYVLFDSAAKVFVAHERFADVAIVAADSAGVPGKHRFSVGDIDGFTPLEKVLAAQPEGPPPHRIGGFILNYTSGTTGRPKGVRRDSIGHDADVTAELMTMLLSLFEIPIGDGVHLVTSPLYHTAVSGFALAMLHAGHSLVVMDRWDAEQTLKLVERYGVTTTHMVPTMFQRLMRLPEEARTRYDVSSLTHIVHTAAPCPVPTKAALMEWLGPKVYEYYAATEGGGTLATPQEWLAKPGTVGRAWSFSKVEVRGDDGVALPPGEIGKVWMSLGDIRFEYGGDPEKTRRTWDGAFFSVGDIGYLDADGYLFLCDREADIVIVGGVNVYPAEIESVLAMHPYVDDVAVVGVPDDDLGERVHALVQPTPGAPGKAVLEPELLRWCVGRLARYKWPRGVDVIDALPRDPSGKLFRRAVRDRYWKDADRRI